MSDPDKKSATGREESLTHDRPKTGPAAAESQQDSSEFIETERFHSDVLEPPKQQEPATLPEKETNSNIRNPLAATRFAVSWERAGLARSTLATILN